MSVQDERNLLDLFSDFHNSRVLNTRINTTFIAMVPNNASANRVDYFRLISLVTILYKIMAKVLPKRLLALLQEMIASLHGAFLETTTIGCSINRKLFWCLKISDLEEWFQKQLR